MERHMRGRFRGRRVRGGMLMGRREELYLPWTDSTPRLAPHRNRSGKESGRRHGGDSRMTSWDGTVEWHHERVHDIMRGKVNNVIRREGGREGGRR